MSDSNYSRIVTESETMGISYMSMTHNAYPADDGPQKSEYVEEEIKLGPTPQDLWESKQPLQDHKETEKNQERPRNAIRHATAAALLAVLGIAPAVAYFTFVKRPFTAYPARCRSQGALYSAGSMAWSNRAPGATGLFTIDRFAGHFAFWQVKLIDIGWDLVVGRGGQLLAWFLTYDVFTNAMLRVIEMSPIPYRTFTDLTINGACISTVWSILLDLNRYSKNRVTFLFTHAFFSLLYVIAWPTLFSSITGYNSISTAFTKVSVEGYSAYIHQSELVEGFVVDDVPGLRNGTCVERTRVEDAEDQIAHILSECTPLGCSLNNTASQLDQYAQIVNECGFSRNDTYSYGLNCNDTINVWAAEKLFPAQAILPHISEKADADGNRTSPEAARGIVQTWCHSATAFTFTEVENLTRCLPDSNTPEYMYGFAAMLGSVVFTLHLLWSLILYAIFLDTELRSPFVRRGYRLTQLRGMFATGAAAQQTTGLSVAELTERDAEAVERRLYARDAAVDHRLFLRELPYAGESTGEEA